MQHIFRTRRWVQERVWGRGDGQDLLNKRGGGPKKKRVLGGRTALLGNKEIITQGSTRKLKGEKGGGFFHCAQKIHL